MDNPNNSGGNNIRRGTVGLNATAFHSQNRHTLLTSVRRPTYSALRGPRPADPQYESIKPDCNRLAVKARNAIRRRLGEQTEALPPKADPPIHTHLNIRRITSQRTENPPIQIREIIAPLILMDEEELIQRVNRLITGTEQKELSPPPKETKRKKSQAKKSLALDEISPHDTEVESVKQALRLELVEFRDAFNKALYEIQDEPYELLEVLRRHLVIQSQRELIGILNRYQLN